MNKKMMYNRFLTVVGGLLVLFCITPISGQHNANTTGRSISNFEILKTKIKEETVSANKIAIARSFLKKAKAINDTLGIADSYYFLSKLDRTYNGVYADSLIDITIDKKYNKYPAFGYLLRGNIEYEKGNYPTALELYLTASKYARKRGDEHMYYSLKFNIGLLKNTAGERLEAQKLFIDYLGFIKTNPTLVDKETYNRVIFALADSYLYSNQLEKAKKYLDSGSKLALETEDTFLYSNYMVSYGIYYYFLKDYTSAIDNLKQGKELIKKIDPNSTRTVVCDYYIARSYQDLGEVETSIGFFENVDEILSSTEDIIPDLIDTYQYLISYYESKGDWKTQIGYINTLLRLDTIRHANAQYLTKNINNRYDAVELVEKKEVLIQQLQRQKELSRNTNVILGFFLVLLASVAGFGFWKNYRNKKYYKSIVLQEKIVSQENETIETDRNTKPETTKEEIDIPEDLIENVLHKLDVFENSHRFSKKHYTLNSLAKELNTNSAYLSKIINVYKHINFANYLNNLRIDFAVNQLSSDKSLRSYTIKAIAQEVGFKNAQSFSSAFHRRKGIYPSCFIKELSSN